MDSKQVEEYEMCKAYLGKLKEWRKSMPFKIQHHGCGSQRPQIEHSLERIHKDMYSEIIGAVDEAIDTVEVIVSKI